MKTDIAHPSTGPLVRLTPLGVSDVDLAGGFWGDRVRVNRDRTLMHGYEQLRAMGTLDNLRLAAGAKGRYRALTDSAGFAFPFLDSDVYKWLEAVGWELGRAPDERLAAAAEDAIAVVAAAQRPDGYINSYVQVVAGGEPYRDLAWGHEFYCVGHLIQAAVAWHRALGDDRLLGIATRAADSIDREFGPDGRSGIDGHPGIEMALVELTRVTGHPRYVRLASRMIEARGHGLLGGGRFGDAYWQDHLPVRDAPTVVGHAVRQMYLDCGAVDVAVELGDRELLDAVIRRWADLVRTRSYLTGGLGSRFRDEAFGDPFELPPDQAYAETCAAIASVMLAWRLLLATGDLTYADAIERTTYNGLLSGIALDGTHFFYVNPLQRRTHRAATAPGDGERAPWFPCACCPPNLMRFISTWRQYLATSDATGIQIHQYAPAEIRGRVGEATVRLAVETGYPWDGTVRVRVLETPAAPWTLSLRVPGWYGSATLGENGAEATVLPAGARSFERHRVWRAGDTVALYLDMPIRVTEPAPEIDAVRGCVAIERGPLVYCLETIDLPPGTELEDLAIDPTRQPSLRPDVDAALGVVGVTVPVVRRASSKRIKGSSAAELSAGAIPYFAWANRAVDAMRVWIPVEPATSAANDDATNGSDDATG